MRLRFCGTVIVLYRKQLAIIGLLAAAALVWALHVVSQVTTTTTGTDDDGDSVRPILIDEVLRRRRQADRTLANTDTVAEKDGRGGGLGGRSDRSVMAMDEARAQRGASIDAARRRLIAAQRRAPDSRYNINVTLSDLTSPDRVVQDTRPPICLSVQYTDKQLPTASVIIPFYNEALTMLLRAVHSVLNKSPDKLLDEV